MGIVSATYRDTVLTLTLLHKTSVHFFCICTEEDSFTGSRLRLSFVRVCPLQVSLNYKEILFFCQWYFVPDLFFLVKGIVGRKRQQATVFHLKCIQPIRKLSSHEIKQI